MRAGKLDRKITIQRKVIVRDSFGGVDKDSTWEEFATVWAHYMPLSGKEFYEARRDNAEITAKFRIRYLDGLSAEMRVQHDGMNFNIESIIPLGRDVGIDLMGSAEHE